MVGRGVSVGHRAVLHGCTVEDDVLIGMGAVVLNGAVVGTGSLVAAGTVVLEGTRHPAELAGRRRTRQGPAGDHRGRARAHPGQCEGYAALRNAHAAS